jgi:uncharacterized protein with PQ loop repeat
MTAPPYLLQKCYPASPEWICITVNMAGIIGNFIWFIVLYPQLIKNYKTRSVHGLLFKWAFCNFTALLVSSFFVFKLLTYRVP